MYYFNQAKATALHNVLLTPFGLGRLEFPVFYIGEKRPVFFLDNEKSPAVFAGSRSNVSWDSHQRETVLCHL